MAKVKCCLGFIKMKSKRRRRGISRESFCEANIIVQITFLKLTYK